MSHKEEFKITGTFQRRIEPAEPIYFILYYSTRYTTHRRCRNNNHNNNYTYKTNEIDKFFNFTETIHAVETPRGYRRVRRVYI